MLQSAGRLLRGAGSATVRRRKLRAQLGQLLRATYSSYYSPSYTAPYYSTPSYYNPGPYYYTPTYPYTRSYYGYYYTPGYYRY